MIWRREIGSVGTIVERDYCSRIKILGVAPPIEAGPGFPLILHRPWAQPALRPSKGPVSVSIPNANLHYTFALVVLSPTSTGILIE